MAIELSDLPMYLQERIAKQTLEMMGNQEILRQERAARANSEGRLFEQEILKACEYYRENGRASVDKTPEAFRVTKLLGNGRFQGRFTGKAQPDFQGVLAGGRAILFDAKYTGKDRIEASALTKHQRDLLEIHCQLGALCGVCVGTPEGAAFVPWEVWRTMKERYGRKYMTEAELREFRVKAGVCSWAMFLDRAGADSPEFV